MRDARIIALVLAAMSAGCEPDFVGPGYVAATVGDDGGTASLDSPSSLGIDAAGVPSAVETGAGVDAEAGSVEGSAPPGPCDLSGRWIVTRREVATAIGAKEAAHTWFYYEMTQVASRVSVVKGLHCGENVRGISSVSANVDYPKTWPAMMTKEPDTGRTGTSSATSSGCQVAFEKHYDVAGATVSAYADPSKALPTASEQAAGATPGWEDWDGDGNPGYTMNVTGLVTGQIYIATRSWSVWSGAIAASATTFTLAVDWGTEQDVLGINGPPLLSQAASGVKDNVTTEHFVTFARLGGAQAIGTDDEVCSTIRSLAPALTPTASN